MSAADIKALCDSGEIDIVCVMGPTASGKTAFAVRLARELNTAYGCPKVEIISADSRQVYRGMDIGTGKDLEEYGEIPVHLVDIAEPGARYNICAYQRDFSAVYADCLRRGVLPVLCGGSGLYVEAVTRPEYEMREQSRSTLALPSKPYFLAVLVDRDERRARIDRRLDERLEEGLVEEVRGLLRNGVAEETLLRYGLEYRFVTLYIKGELTFEQMHEQLRFAIHRFAKRQMTWLRGMEKDGVRIHWVEI